MTRFARFLIRFYPAAWRKRYGDEFDALLTAMRTDVRAEDTRPDIAILFDLLKGALRMQFSTWSFPRLAVSLGLLGAILGFGVSLLQPRNYIASATVHITGSDSPHDIAFELQRELTSRYVLSSLIQDVGLYPEQRRNLPLEDIIEAMKTRDLTIGIPAAGSADNTISISFRYPDQDLARNTVRDVAIKLQVILATETKNNAQIPLDAKYIPSLDVLEPPNVPMFMENLPHPERIPFIGALIGFTVAALLFLRPRRRKFHPLRWTAAGFVLGFILWVGLEIPFAVNGLLGYRSTATVLLPEGYAGPVGELIGELTSRSTLAQVVQDPHLQLYSIDLRKQPLEDIVAHVKRDLTVTPGPMFKDRGFQMIPLEISFVYRDRYKTHQTVSALMNQLDVIYRDRVRTKWGLLPYIPLEVRNGVDPARLAALPPMPRPALGTVDPNVPITTLGLAPYALPPARTGLLIGLALATIIGLVRRRLVFAAEDIGADTGTRLIRFSGSRFRKLAIILTSCGIVLAAIDAWRYPAIYTAESVVSTTIYGTIPQAARSLKYRRPAFDESAFHYGSDIDHNIQLSYRSTSPDIAESNLRDIQDALSVTTQMRIVHALATTRDSSLGLWGVPLFAAIGLALAALFSLTGPQPDSPPAPAAAALE